MVCIHLYGLSYRLFDNFPSVGECVRMVEFLGETPNFVVDYINISSKAVLASHHVLITEDIINIKEKINRHEDIVLHGPKGCGKSFATATLFVKLQQSHPCLYVGPNTMDASLSRKYFSTFISQYNNVVTMDPEQMQNLSCSVIELISSFAKKKDLYLFIDCGQFSDQKESCTKFLMELLTLGTQSNRIHKIISVSSGVSANYSDVLIKTIDYFESLSLKGFTKLEATKYIQTINEGHGLTFDKIQEISGTNPLLLSRLNKNLRLSEYRDRVETEVKEFLASNLSLTRGDANSVASFLEKSSHDTCTMFIYYAYRGDELSDSEIEYYDVTWLKKHQVTVLEGRKLKFNFPTLGKQLLDVLRCFVKESEADTVERMRRKERSFAGFLFEAQFHNYCSSKNLVITTCSVDKDTVEECTLIVAHVTDLEGPADKLYPGFLYELRARHPILDYVGCLQDIRKEYYLVFVQVSLKKYNDHSEMSNVFLRPKNKRATPDELKDSKQTNLYSFYLNLAKSYHPLNIIFLYVSPEETNSVNILPKLKAKIKEAKVKETIRVGVLTNTSDFYSNMLSYKTHN